MSASLKSASVSMDKVKGFITKHAKNASMSSSSKEAKAEAKLPVSPTVSIPPVPDEPFPNESDFYRYRKQRGVNLGSWFVLERWIADAPYRNAASPAQSDHDVARGPDARQILEQHWDNWIVEDDWRWLAEHGFNSVRIPIAYYHLYAVEPWVVDGTDFAELGPVFAGAWARITQAIATAHRYGIGVLLDLHCAPGKQNADAHSGVSGSRVAFFEKINLVKTTRILIAMVKHLLVFTRTHNPPLPNLIGLELVNEANPPRPDHTFLHDWYRRTIKELRALDGGGLPFYIGDAWRTMDYAGLLVSAGPQGSGFLALDHHLYRCFTHADHSMSAAQHAAVLRGREGTPASFRQANEHLVHTGGGLVVGEWSAALNPASLHKSQDHTASKRTFVDAQLALYERECAGYFWWTYKKQWPGDDSWSLRDAVEKGTFPEHVGLRRPGKMLLPHDAERARRMEEAKRQALSQHSAYWSKYPGHYEHWRFDEGFRRGWEDAYAFFMFTPGETGSVSEVGFKAAWKQRRTAMHAEAKGRSNNLWEYEHALGQGCHAAHADYQTHYA
ncbi:unnamed protein product [Peniophora sp. CBMAI 1063]|nr:unnamed protein product [Peniophora sp. CBMAI 1063]